MVVDSSVWLEILRDGPLSAKCTKAVQQKDIRVPSLVIFEVYKKIKTKVSEEAALEATAVLSQFEILDLSREVSLLAADLSLEHELAMADSIVLAHATILHDSLLTLDNDFSGVPGVVVLRK